jgi:hypothetical protein
MASKWDLLLKQKPVPVADHLLSECSKLFATELSKWPPEVDGAQLPEKAPGAEVMRVAFRLARWDLAREHDAYDDYMRNQRWVTEGLTPADKPTLLFMSRFIEEQLLALNEATEGRVDRPAMLRVLDLTERAVLKAGQA